MPPRRRQKQQQMRAMPMPPPPARRGRVTGKRVAGGLVVLVIIAVLVAMFRDRINEMLRANTGGPDSAPFQIPELPTVRDMGVYESGDTTPVAASLSSMVAVPVVILFIVGALAGGDMEFKWDDRARMGGDDGSSFTEYIAMMAGALFVTWLLVAAISWWLLESTAVFWVLAVALVGGVIVAIGVFRLDDWFENKRDEAQKRILRFTNDGMDTLFNKDGEYVATKQEHDAFLDRMKTDGGLDRKQRLAVIHALTKEDGRGFAEMGVLERNKWVDTALGAMYNRYHQYVATPDTFDKYLADMEKEGFTMAQAIAVSDLAFDKAARLRRGGALLA